MEGLPFYPGNTFNDPTKNRFHVSQSLGFKNGLAVRRRPPCAVGGMPLPQNNLSEGELAELANYNPTLTYGQAKQAPPNEFVPAQVTLDKKVLCFHTWLKETVLESSEEHYRVRHMDLYYYLEDDSIMIEEHAVKNMGMKQGIYVKRHRIPKDDVGNSWHWKDLNNGLDLTVYGKVFHLYACDKFTYEWLTSQGIVVNPEEECPDDPYVTERTNRESIRMLKTKSDFDALRQFLEMDKRVLRYYAVWDDRDVMFGDLRQCEIHYYLADDTVEVTAVRKRNDGRDPFPVLVRRHKCPKNRYDINPSFPIGVMEPSNEEYCDYFTPVDFKIGNTVVIYNRRFLIYDIDNFTKAFYWKNFGLTDFTPLDVTVPSKPLPKKEIPPYNLHGSMDDSMMNIQTVTPNKPKTDIVKMLDNQGKVLRYEAFLDTTRREDRCRRFIVQYLLAYDTFIIYEPPIPNSGIAGGKFLSKARIAKPGCNPDNPEFYGPADLYIGACIEVFRHRFVITNCDKYVLTYMQEHPQDFPQSVVESIKNKLKESEGDEDGACRPRIPEQDALINVKRTGGENELQELVENVKAQLRKVAYTGTPLVSDEFLASDGSGRGKLSKRDLADLCAKHQLPTDCDVIDKLASEIGRDPDNITLEEFRHFLQDTPDKECYLPQ